MSSPSLNKSEGFTLVELVVTLGIMLVILSSVVLGQSQYSAGASLKNTVNDVSLSIRQAQIYGISVKELKPGSGNFTSGYGMAFSSKNTAGTNNKEYIFFADLGAGNWYYDGNWTCPMVAPTDECLGKTLINNNNIMSDLCVIESTGAQTCGLGRIDIAFVRPKTDAHFIFFDSGLVFASYPNAKGAVLKLSTAVPPITTRSITIYTTGQISVKDL